MRALRDFDHAGDKATLEHVGFGFVGASEEAYLENIGGKEAVAALPLPIF